MPTDLKLGRTDQPWFRRLYLPTYRLSEAARYTRTHVNTVASWHRREAPVLPRKEGGRPLTYFELVEVAFVAFFRRTGVKMRRIRAARDYVSQWFNVEYPLAEQKFKTEGMHVLMEYNEFDPEPAFDQIVVTDEHGQLAWTAMLGDVFAEFDYEYEIALRWHPAGRESMVVIDPRISFGAPIVSGLPTWVVKGRRIAGESDTEIAKEFGLSAQAIHDALQFEGIASNGDMSSA